jgi:hypothetical protein
VFKVLRYTGDYAAFEHKTIAQNTNFRIKIESLQHYSQPGNVEFPSCGNTMVKSDIDLSPHFNCLQIKLRLILGRNHAAKPIPGGGLSHVFHENA